MLVLSALLTNFAPLISPISQSCLRLDSFLKQAQNKAVLSKSKVILEFKDNRIIESDSINTFKLSRKNFFKEISFGNLHDGTIRFEPNSWASAGSIEISSKENKSCKIIQSILGARRIE